MGTNLGWMVVVVAGCAARPASVTLQHVVGGVDARGIDERAASSSDDPLMIALASRDEPLASIMISRTLVDAGGRSYGFDTEQTGAPMRAIVRPGPYTLRILADCQPSLEQPVVVSADAELDDPLPARLDAVAYLRVNTTLAPLGDGDERTIPINTEVREVRRWPSKDDLDNRSAETAEREAVATGTLANTIASANEHLVLRPEQCHAMVVSIAGVAGLYVVSSDQLSDAPISDAVVEQAHRDEDDARHAAEADARARAEANDAALDREVASNQCSPEHDGALQQAMSGLQAIFADGSQGLVILDFQIAVASDHPAALPFTYGTEGEYQVLGIGFAASEIDGGIGPSPYEGAIANMTGGYVSSAVVEVSTSHQPALTATGRGCLLLVFAQTL